MRVIEFIVNLFGWLQIVAGSTLAGALLGAVVYYFNDDIGKIVFVILAGTGMIAGIIWATRIWIRHGTADWLSRTRRIS